ncbi:hypothetical protein ACFFGH_27895 [Lysobacter korlensis]|uniref:Serine kinase/phosphatase n=1 Tax=Lysobacter korlensis TaxID=553636 RepID=A0ABV6RXG3_9GAMM
MTDAQDRVPNAGEDVDDATEPDPEYDQLGSDGNPFERIGAPKEPVSADTDDESFTADDDADFGMGIPSANDPQRLPDGSGPT